MTSLFTRLPVSAPGTIGKINSADINAFSAFDPEAYGFWQFKAQSLKSITDASKVLTSTGSPTFSSNAVTITNEPGKGLISPLNDAGSAFSLTGVIDLSASTFGSTLVIAGNFDNSNGSSGAGIYFSGSGSSTQANLTAGGAGKGVIVDLTKALFFAISIDTSTNKAVCLFKQDGDSNQATVVTMTSYVANSKYLALGSYIGSSVSNIKSYEFAVYDKALSADDVNWKYQLAKTRMKEINVAI